MELINCVCGSSNWFKQILSWSRILLEKLIITQLVNKFPAFFWNPKAHYHVHNIFPLVCLCGHGTVEEFILPHFIILQIPFLSNSQKSEKLIPLSASNKCNGRLSNSNWRLK
jgi:hypothetical protein